MEDCDGRTSKFEHSLVDQQTSQWIVQKVLFTTIRLTLNLSNYHIYSVLVFNF